MLIRGVNKKDAESLNLLMKEGFGWEDNNDFSQSFFSNKNIFCLVAESEKGQIMGSSSLHIIEKINRKVGLIEDVVVFKKYRGKSVASTLVSAIELNKETEIAFYNKSLKSFNENYSKIFENIGNLP